MPLRKRLKLKRSVGGALPKATDLRSETTLTIEQSHARQILKLPQQQLQSLIEGLRDGASAATIARHFADQGWLEVTEKSFQQYISAFKRVYPDKVRGQNGDEKNLNHYVDPRQPDVDEEIALQQLLRINNRRIAIGHKFEDTAGFINKDLHKDIQTSINIVESLSTLRGGGKKAGRPSAGANVAMSNEAQEALRKSSTNEGTADKLAHLTSQLIPLMKIKQGQGG